jgi:Holliday junction resolvasome RuvABC endonuclease subunit
MSELILALDPSTDITGAAILQLNGLEVSLIAYTAFDAFELTGQPKSRHKLVDRLARIAETRHALSAWLATQPVVECVAYETQSGRGHASSEALVMAVGAYLTLSRLRRRGLIEVNRSSGCAAVGASKVYSESAGTTAKEKEAKRARLKQAVIAGVNTKMGLTLTEDQDAEADAIAVGLAAASKIYRKPIKNTPSAVLGKTR